MDNNALGSDKAVIRGGTSDRNDALRSTDDGNDALGGVR